MAEKEISINTHVSSKSKESPKESPKSLQESKVEEKLFQSKGQFEDVAGKLEVNSSKPEDVLEAIMKADESQLLPWEEIELPSLGLYYDGKIPNGIVKIRPMGIHADKILATSRLAKTGQALDYLFEHCVKFPNPFDVGDLIAGDRTFLLYVLRGVTHGNIYEFQVKCPECEHPNIHTYDLNNLAGTIKKANPDLGSEPFRVDLPYMSKITGQSVWVGVRMPRGKDTSIIANRQKFKRRAQPVYPGQKQAVVLDESFTENLYLIIDNFMGVTDRSKIKALIDNEKIHSSDLAIIRTFLQDNSPGIDTKIKIKCEECGLESEVMLPITESFFRPTPG